MQNENGITADWREKIAGKKVIFYNTGVSSLLNGNEKHIEKMNCVFDEFKEYSDAVLWWRPHPLELTTVESMRPALRNYYLKTKSRFVEENIGILDESADLNRAIAVSDAYYGSSSSVVQLFSEARKPVMLCDVGAERNWTNITALYCLESIDNKIIAMPIEGNNIISFDTLTERFEIKNSIPVANKFVQICAIQDFAISGNDIITAGYDGGIMKGNIKDLHLKSIFNCHKCIFRKILNSDNIYFFLADCLDRIVMYNSLSDKHIDIQLEKAYSMVDGVIAGKILYVLTKENTIIQYDIDSGSIQYYKFESNINYYMLEEYNGNIWLFGDDEAVLLNLNAMDIVKIVKFPIKNNPDQLSFFKTPMYNEKCYIIHYPRQKNKHYSIFEFDFKNDTISEFTNDIPGCYDACIANEHLYLCPYTGGLISISLRDKTIAEFHLTNDEKNKMIELMIDNMLKIKEQILLKESSVLDFKKMLLVIDKSDYHNTNKPKNFGELIYNEMKIL